MNMEYREKMPMLVRALLDEKRNDLPLNVTNQIAEYIDHDEWGIAFEGLCDQLEEYQIPLDSKYYMRLEHVAKLMEIDSSYWLPLKELIIDKEQ